MQPFVTFFVGIIAASAAIWAVVRGYRNALELQRENFRQQLKTQIHKDLAPYVMAVHQASTDIGQMPTSISLEFLAAKHMVSMGGTPEPIKHRAPDLIEGASTFNDKVSALIGFVEQHEIIKPELMIFRLALCAALDDFRDAQSKYFNKVLSFLPFDTPNSPQKVFARPLPNDEQQAELDEYGQRVNEKAIIVSSYAMDLNVEAQNILLGGLFGTKVPKRKPLDPSYLVLTTEPEDFARFKKYFEEDSPFGKKQKAAEAEWVAKRNGAGSTGT